MSMSSVEGTLLDELRHLIYTKTADAKKVYAYAFAWVGQQQILPVAGPDQEHVAEMLTSFVLSFGNAARLTNFTGALLRNDLMYCAESSDSTNQKYLTLYGSFRYYMRMAIDQVPASISTP
jgi:hypothetical protein